RSVRVAFRLQLPRISEPGGQMRIDVLIRLPRPVLPIQQPPGVFSAEHLAQGPDSRQAARSHSASLQRISASTIRLLRQLKMPPAPERHTDTTWRPDQAVAAARADAEAAAARRHGEHERAGRHELLARSALASRKGMVRPVLAADRTSGSRAHDTGKIPCGGESGPG